MPQTQTKMDRSRGSGAKAVATSVLPPRSTPNGPHPKKGCCGCLSIVLLLLLLIAATYVIWRLM